ncbi:MAG: trypsin-like peptidase domain-containing protein [Myxococcales bacterium]|nr:trypsin-like peptidase domain-containing protein [Myxococcales bacterium]
MSRPPWYVLASAALVGCSGPPPTTPPSPSASVQAAPAPPEKLSARQILERATPAIVTVLTPRGLGTGFVVKPEGWIATNLHVVAGASAFKVVMADESTHDVVEVMGYDDKRDLVLLRIEAKALPTLTLGKADDVKPGDPVVAIGHPMGLQDTVSDGLISGKRVIDPELTVLQISAPIAPGSSGGPLFNDRGEVVGVAAAVSRRGQNLNFGIPIDYLEELLARAAPMSVADFIDQLEDLAPKPLPRVQRDIPRHDLWLLSGCAKEDLILVGATIQQAIEVGAPLYNEGNFSACFHIYEGASLDLDRRLPQRCPGPKKALGDGRRKAAKLDDPAAQAWAMRDAFDGLLEVITRKLTGEPSP